MDKNRIQQEIPTVEFDSSSVNELVKENIKNNLLQLPEIDKNNFQQIYEAALKSVLAGGALNILYDALLGAKIDALTKKRAGWISRFINNRATFYINRNRQTSLGITHAEWMYSGAPCDVDDYLHKRLNGKKYLVSDGVVINGKKTWPGYEFGCRCISKSVIKGFE